MSKSIRISDELLEAAKAHASLFHRSPPQQIEHWAGIGKVLEPVLNYEQTQQVKCKATDKAIEEAYQKIGSPEAIARTQKIISETSG